MEYTCTLNEKSLKKAKEELNEDPREREGAAQALREWVEREKWLKTPTDTAFLMAFLRVRKFSQLSARELLEKYWTMRTKYSRWFRGRDPDEEKILRTIRETCFIVPLPGVDEDGRKSVLMRFAAVDPQQKEITADDVMAAKACIFDALLYDENIQVNGFNLMIDFKGLTMPHIINFYGFDTVKSDINMLQKTAPLRMKKMCWLNTGAVFEAFYNLFSPFMGEKMKNRTSIHGNSLVKFYKETDLSRLPEEYLPDDYEGPRAGTMKEIIENYLKESYLKPEILAYVRDLQKGDYKVDLHQKPASKGTEQSSYRKLNVT